MSVPRTVCSRGHDYPAVYLTCPRCAEDADKRKQHLSTLSARVVEVAVRARARWGRNVTINDLRVIGIDEDTLTLFTAVDALLAAKEGR